MKKLFKAIDTNADGLLDSTEIKALCVGSGIELSARAHRQLMKQFASKSGLITFDEFFKWYADASTGIETHTTLNL